MRTRNALIILIVLTTTPGQRCPAQLDANPPQAHGATNTLHQIAELNPHLDRADPRQWATRILVLSRDPQTFFRGTADLFYAYCRNECADWMTRKDLRIRLHGDVHPGNVGTCRPFDHDDAPRFGLVDFDETFLGPYQLDLLRAATALRFACSGNSVEITEPQWRATCARMCDAYRRTLVDASADRDAADHPLSADAMNRAARGDLAAYNHKYLDGGRLQFVRLRGPNDQPREILEPVEDKSRSAVARALATYARDLENRGDATPWKPELAQAPERFLCDVARWTKLSSAGSQGVWKLLVMLEEPLTASNESAILQFKEEPPAAAIRAGLVDASPIPRAREVADAYRRLHSHRGVPIGWCTMDGRQFLVKPKSPWNKELEAAQVRDVKSLQDMAEVIGLAVGTFHRQSCRDTAAAASGDPAEQDKQKAAILTDLPSLPERLAERSARLYAAIQDAFLDLSRDPDARALGSRATAFIASVATGKSEDTTDGSAGDSDRNPALGTTTDVE